MIQRPLSAHPGRSCAIRSHPKGAVRSALGCTADMRPCPTFLNIKEVADNGCPFVPCSPVRRSARFIWHNSVLSLTMRPDDRVALVAWGVINGPTGET